MPLNFIVRLRSGNVKPDEFVTDPNSSHIPTSLNYPPEVAVLPPIYEIRFVEKTLRLTPWELVTHLLGNRPDGSSWGTTYFDAIRLVEDGKAHFYIMRSGLRIELIVVNNAWGYKCLRAKEDATSEVLLNLPTPNE